MRLTILGLDTNQDKAYAKGKPDGFGSFIRIVDYAAAGRIVDVYRSNGGQNIREHSVGNPKTTYRECRNNLAAEVVASTSIAPRRFGRVNSFVAKRHGSTWDRIVCTFNEVRQDQRGKSKAVKQVVLGRSGNLIAVRYFR